MDIAWHKRLVFIPQTEKKKNKPVISSCPRPRALPLCPASAALDSVPRAGAAVTHCDRRGNLGPQGSQSPARHLLGLLLMSRASVPQPGMVPLGTRQVTPKATADPHACSSLGMGASPPQQVRHSSPGSRTRDSVSTNVAETACTVTLLQCSSWG